MKVTVSKFLNVRVGKPDVNADCYQYLAPGSTIEVEDTLYEGGDFRGNTKWFRDQFNNYYWSGGFSDHDFSSKFSEEDQWKHHSLPWYIRRFDIQQKWLAKIKGEGVSIAILDSGCNEHNQYKTQIKYKRNFFTDTTDVQDNIGHGSHVAGIIAANGSENIYGIAPKVDLFIGKIINHASDGLDPMVIAKAIDHFSEKVDIINLSFGFPDEHSVITEAINRCSALIVAAHGNDKGQKRTIGDYPAISHKCLSVGSLGFSNNIFHLAPALIRGSIDIVAPGEDILSIDKNGVAISKSGSSMATAYVSGVLALLKSENTFNNIHGIKEELISASHLITEKSIAYNMINLPNNLLL